MSRPPVQFLFCGAIIIYATKCPAEARVQDTDGIDVQSIGRFFSAISFFVPDVRRMMFSRMYKNLGPPFTQQPGVWCLAK